MQYRNFFFWPATQDRMPLVVDSAFIYFMLQDRPGGNERK